jgi:hypothetical protein
MTDEFEGAVAELEGHRFVEAFGRKFAVADKVALMPLLKFAHLSKKGVDSSDMEALAVMHDLLRTCFTDEAWAEFEDAATEQRANDEELLKVVSAAIEVIGSRPPTSPSVSSDGPPTTSENLTESASSESVEDSFEARKKALGLVPVGDLLGLTG